MANPEHLAKLRECLQLGEEGITAWNQWRKKHLDIHVDLYGAHLSGVNFTGIDFRRANFIKADLREANLSIADLYGADLSGIDLSGVDLRGAHLSGANLYGANLREADLRETDLRETDLNEADLRKADLHGAHLSGADLYEASLYETDFSGADLSGVDLRGADLYKADLRRADLTNAHCNKTIFANVDLQTVKGLETIKHRGPSTIGIDTIYRSQGNIPEVFLKGAGVDDTFISYIRSLVGKPIDYYSCFISYSSRDQAFAERLFADLQSKNVRCWFAPHHMKIGDKIRSRIDESIRVYDKLLLILSHDSVLSPWVEHEVETAFDKEREGHPNILFPVRIDETIMSQKIGWANHIRTTRHIGDFTQWKNHDAYQVAFTRLLHDLKAQS